MTTASQRSTSRNEKVSCASVLAGRKRPRPRRASARPAAIASVSALVPSTCRQSRVPAAARGSAPLVCRASDSRSAVAAAGRRVLELLGGDPQRPREVGPAVAAQRQQVVDDRGGRPRAVVVEQDQRLGRERDDAAAQTIRTAAPTTAAAATAASATAWPLIEPLRSTSRQIARGAAANWRATMVLPSPGRDPQAALERSVDVEVAVDRRRPGRPSGGSRAAPPGPQARPAAAAAARPAAAPGGGAPDRWRPPGRPAARRRRRRRAPAAPANAARSSGPTSRRDLGEARRGRGEPVAGERAARRRVDGPARLGGAQRAAPPAVAGRRGARSPRRRLGSAVSACVEQLGDHLLGAAVLVLVDPGSARTAPPRRRRAGRRERAASCSRSCASPRARRTMSIAPRTEEPLRTAGCVARAARDRHRERRPPGRRHRVWRRTTSRSPSSSR